MNNSQMISKIKIAASMLGEVRKSGYGNQRITHANRDFVTDSVTEILEEVLIFLDNLTPSIISNSPTNTNPSEEI
jgi:hypothetical protein